MNSPHLRIFLATSQISAVYVTMLANSTRQANDVDVLFIDGSKRKRILIELVKQTGELGDWKLFYDFSIDMGDKYDFNPSTTKSLTRRIKTWPVIKHFYNSLLDKHYAQMDAEYKAKISQVLDGCLHGNPSVSLFMQTQTYLNRPLQQLFPKAELNYSEHGMGDYYYMTSPETPKGNFYCFFSERFKQFLAKKGHSTDWVKQLPGAETFPAFVNKFRHKAASVTLPDKPLVFILLEAVDMYEVNFEFWSDYPDHIFKQLKNPGSYHYLLKPHPIQSEVSIAATKKHFDKLGYSYTLLNQPELFNSSAEILFNEWADKTEHAFCLFSSGIYYLSKLYAGKNIRFWYSTEFLSKYVKNAPPQFAKLFREIRPLIEEVLSENCTPY